MMMEYMDNSPIYRPPSAMKLLAYKLQSSQINDPDEGDNASETKCDFVPIEKLPNDEECHKISSSVPSNHRLSIPSDYSFFMNDPKYRNSCIMEDESFQSNFDDINSPELPPKRKCHSVSNIPRPIAIKPYSYVFGNVNHEQKSMQKRSSFLELSKSKSFNSNCNLSQNRPVISPNLKRSAFTPTHNLIGCSNVESNQSSRSILAVSRQQQISHSQACNSPLAANTTSDYSISPPENPSNRHHVSTNVDDENCDDTLSPVNNNFNNSSFNILNKKSMNKYHFNNHTCYNRPASVTSSGFHDSSQQSLLLCSNEQCQLNYSPDIYNHHQLQQHQNHQQLRFQTNQSCLATTNHDNHSSTISMTTMSITTTSSSNNSLPNYPTTTRCHSQPMNNENSASNNTNTKSINNNNSSNNPAFPINVSNNSSNCPATSKFNKYSSSQPSNGEAQFSRPNFIIPNQSQRCKRRYQSSSNQNNCSNSQSPDSRNLKFPSSSSCNCPNTSQNPHNHHYHHHHHQPPQFRHTYHQHHHKRPIPSSSSSISSSFSADNSPGAFGPPLLGNSNSNSNNNIDSFTNAASNCSNNNTNNSNSYFFGNTRSYLTSLPRIASSPTPSNSNQATDSISPFLNNQPSDSISHSKNIATPNSNQPIGKNSLLLRRQRIGSNCSSNQSSSTTNANTPTVPNNNNHNNIVNNQGVMSPVTTVATLSKNISDDDDAEMVELDITATTFQSSSPPPQISQTSRQPIDPNQMLLIDTESSSDNCSCYNADSSANSSSTSSFSNPHSFCTAHNHKVQQREPGDPPLILSPNYHISSNNEPDDNRGKAISDDDENKGPGSFQPLDIEQIELY